MKTSPAGLELIKKFEGLRLKAYLCPAGVPTIGYGSTAGVKLGDCITAEEAEARLVRELVIYERAVRRALDPGLGTPGVATQSQFDALVSLCYNIGPRHLATSTVVRRLLAGNVQGAADAFRMWVKAKGQVLPGLVRRREAERALFLSGVETTEEDHASEQG